MEALSQYQHLARAAVGFVLDKNIRMLMLICTLKMQIYAIKKFCEYF